MKLVKLKDMTMIWPENHLNIKELYVNTDKILYIMRQNGYMTNIGLKDAMMIEIRKNIDEVMKIING